MAKIAVKRKLKKTLLVIAMLVLVFCVYVEVVNRNSKQMTYKQKILKAVYPALMWFSKIAGTKSTVMENKNNTVPPVSFYTLSAKLNNGSELKLADLKGKKILLVNTASNCGYTNQYDDLQKLYAGNTDKLVIIGFPANDFKEQEKGTDSEIAEFCRVNFGVSFPLAQKTTVVKGAEQNAVFKWLSDKTLNGWNDQEPTWNFAKYLIDENGILVKYFDPGISPASDEIKKAIE